jgi:hypothetical protein
MVRVANIDLQNRAPEVTRTPDFRNHIERKYAVLNNVAKTPAEVLAECWLPLGTVDELFTNAYLIEQKIVGQMGPYKAPVQEPPYLLRVFEELNGLNETQIGSPSVVMDQYGNRSVIFTYWQLNLGTSTYQVPGVTLAPSPFEACFLKTEERTNDSTLRKIVRTYIDAGELSDNERLLFGGRLKIRELTYLNQIPPTPSGYTLTTRSTEFILGLPVYKYGFVDANAAGVLGNGIGLGIEYGQSITEGVTTGTTTTTIRQISDLTVVSNPITTPSGQVLIRINYEDDAGYRLWTGVYVKAVVGTVDIQTEGREDGSLVYDITALGMAVAIPAYPGSGTGYNTSKSSVIRDGFYVNRATWVKPPPDTTYRQQQEFKMPGLAYFVGTDLILQPGAVMQLLGSLAVTFSTSQVTTDPFFVKQWAGFIETYIPVGGSAVNNQFGLNGYLATGNSSSGTGLYKGVDCSSWSYQRFASDPTALPSGTIVVGVRNDPYLTDVNGTVIFKRSVMSITIP